MTKRIAAIAIFALWIAAPSGTSVTAQQEDARQGRSTAKFHRKGNRALPNHYIVVLADDAARSLGDYALTLGRAQDVMRLTRAVPSHVYAFALNGFSAEMSEAEAIALSEDLRVRLVEEDSTVEALVTQSNPPWGLDRIGQRDLPLNGAYGYTSTGAGVNAYVIDTGIRTTHTQFGTRASGGFTAIGDGRGTTDCNGHGTHVAGTIGGSTYGVAKSVRLIAVRVLSCSGSGSTSGVIAGVDWVTAHRVRPAVANMSLGGISTALDTAVRNSIAAGVTYAVAAGNSNTNAANSSPARVAEAITVGATTRTDARSSFSNFGSVVDIFAPGSAILSAYSTSNTATATLSGTSMAAPHVAGVAARYLQNNTSASPATVRNSLVTAATTGRLAGIPTGTANRLLFWSSSR
jgi:aqualysin 1